MKVQRNIIVRVFLNVALAVSLVLLPWFVSLPFALVLLFRFRAYEILLWGVLADALYGAPVSVLGGLPIFFTLIFTLLFVAVEYSKRFLVFY